MSAPQPLDADDVPQMLDALSLVNAYIVARARHDDYLEAPTLDARHAWHAAGAHADELLEVFVARYGATR